MDYSSLTDTLSNSFMAVLWALLPTFLIILPYILYVVVAGVIFWSMWGLITRLKDMTTMEKWEKGGYEGTPNLRTPEWKRKFEERMKND